MKYFTNEYIDFFKELSNNNNKEWFHANKKRYEEHVKKPFALFVSAMIDKIQSVDSTLQIETKDCISRINRDVRFSKDKTPYNLHLNAFVSYGGRKDKSIPGLFLRFSSETVGIMGGCFGPDKNQLQKIRKAILNDQNGFQKLLEDKTFVSKFRNLKGEVNKRLPTEFKNEVVDCPIIANKQYYFIAEREADLIIKDDLVDQLFEYYLAAKPINSFLLQSIKSQ